MQASTPTPTEILRLTLLGEIERLIWGESPTNLNQPPFFHKDQILGTKQPILITMKVHSKYVDFRETV
jgi:hypothetical protein